LRRFFDKRATVVDVTDKEVIDLFKDGLYHHRTFKDFGRRRPSSIIKLMDMITSWADEEDKVLMVNSCIEFRLDSQAYKSPVVV
jgi:hypothetical protein